MKWKSLAVVFGVLVLATGTMAQIPNRWDGNNYGLIYANMASLPSYHFAWVQWPDPVFPQMTWEYRLDETSWRFTAGASGSIQALQWYSRTPGAKMGQLDPQLTVSIQTDDGSGKPSGVSVGSYTGTFPLGVQSNGGLEYRDPVTVPVSASLTAGNVYHIVVKCDSMTTFDQWAFGGDYANSTYDFRMTASRGGNPLPNKIRLYDGTEDPNMMGLYYNRISGGAYENQWMVGSPDETTDSPDGHNPAQRGPLFEMFADYDSQTQTVSNPVPRLAEGPGPGLNNMIRKGVRLRTVTESAGERLPVYYPNAKPVAKKVRMFLGKTTTPPATDLVLEVRDGSNTVVASATVPEANVLANQHSWIEADLSGDVSLPGKELAEGTYYVVARLAGAPAADAYYSIAMQEQRNIAMPTKENGHMGTLSVLVESTDSGATWTPDDTVDACFSLGVVIPGDANGDEIVNVGDLGILGANYGQSPRDWSQADFNGDLIVNVGDLGILGAHYGEFLDPSYYTPPAPGAGGLGDGVPEPATISLLVLGGLGLIRHRRR